MATPRKKGTKKVTYSTTTPKKGTYGGTTSATKTKKRKNVTKTKTVSSPMNPTAKSTITKTKVKTKKKGFSNKKTLKSIGYGPTTKTVKSRKTSANSVGRKKAKRVEARFTKKSKK